MRLALYKATACREECSKQANTATTAMNHARKRLSKTMNYSAKQHLRDNFLINLIARMVHGAAAPWMS